MCHVIQEHPMRMIIVLAAAFAVLAFTQIDARADGAWCARDVRGGTNCGFHTYAQCMAYLSGIGGVCERNLFYQGSVSSRRPRSR
jgi:hypothetical protein